MYVGKDYEGSSGWFGSGGQYVIAGTGNYPMDFWTNTVKRLSILGNGNVNFEGTGQRITGRFGSTPVADRTIFQTNITNDNSNVGVIPNGTAQIAQFTAFNSSDPTNASTLVFQITSSVATISSAIVGTGTYLPITFSTNGAERARIATNGDFSFNSGYGSAAVAYGCRAWVNFNGTGTVAIRASGNVSSITDNGTGDYTVNFTTAMPDANYAASAIAQRDVSGSSNQAGFVFIPANGSTVRQTASAFRVMTTDQGMSVQDAIVLTVAIFR